MLKIFLLIFLLNSQWLAANASKILIVFPAPSPSHYYLANALARELAERGHDITIVSPFSEKNPPKNGTYREIVLTGVLEEMQEMRKQMNFFDFVDINPFVMLTFMNWKQMDKGHQLLDHPNFKKLIHSNEKFDLVVVEKFMNDVPEALAAHFGAPLVGFSTQGANSWTNPQIANPAPPSYIPEAITNYSSDMNFWQRLTNTLVVLYANLLNHLVVFPNNQRVIHKHLSTDIDFYDVHYNISLTLLNSHPSMNQPVPHVPNMVEIGGFHIKPPKKLPEDLQKFLDNSPEGVIYFSMGSNLRSADLPAEKREAILNVFSKLKHKVLWKWEDDELPGKPPNVKIMKWLPQQDILAHKNVKLFITHGGLLSTTETIYHGVPILAIPIFGDQSVNAKMAVSGGFAVMLPYRQLTEETFRNALNEILNNKKYTINAKKRAEIFHDREKSPMDTAVYWIEYVIRHQGTPHLRVAGVDLPWYKYHLVDVFLFLILVISIILYINFLIVRKILRKFGFCKSPKVDKKKTQ